MSSYIWHIADWEVFYTARSVITLYVILQLVTKKLHNSVA